MKKICVIGNNANGNLVTDGGRLKIRLYVALLKRLGYGVNLVELDDWVKHVVTVVISIRRAIVSSDTILVMAGPKGCRFIIPLVNFLNRKFHRRVVFCPLGIGTLDKLVSRLSPQKVSEFLSCNNFFGLRDNTMAHQLSKLDVIIPQNEVLTNAYRVFYGLNNCHTLRNFRDVEIVEKKDIHSNKDGILRVVYASRITENKGIFDLLFAVADINQKSHSPLLVLDIYGDIQLQGQLLTKFNDYLGPQISYKGVLDNRAIVQTISEYDLFCLPTKYHGEGTPGVLLESFFAGTPALISSFSHAKHLIQNGFDGIIYDINDPKDLRQKMADIISNKTILEKIRVNVQKTAEKYTFEANKKDFIYFITGEVL